MKPLLLFTCSLFFLSAKTFAQQRKIIDVHFHARGAQRYGPAPPPNHMTGRVPTYKTDAEVVEQMYKRLKENGIVTAIASGQLSRVADFVKRDAKLFIPSFDFGDDGDNPLPDTNTFKQWYAEGKFLVFGELALQYDGMTITDPSLAPYLSICERLGIPVALHTGEGAPASPFTCCPKFRTVLGRPQTAEEVLIKYPKLKMQIMHMGYPYLDETLAMLHMYPNLYADIAVVNWAYPVATFHRYLKTLVDAGFGKRLMYGSDQMAWDDAIPLSVKNVESASFLTETQKQDIFYNNAKRFYGFK
jgi:uncharacterized protein